MQHRLAVEKKVKKNKKEVGKLVYFTGRIGRTVFWLASFKTSARPR